MTISNSLTRYDDGSVGFTTTYAKFSNTVDEIFKEQPLARKAWQEAIVEGKWNWEQLKLEKALGTEDNELNVRYIRIMDDQVIAKDFETHSRLRGSTGIYYVIADMTYPKNTRNVSWENRAKGHGSKWVEYNVAGEENSEITNYPLEQLFGGKHKK